MNKKRLQIAVLGWAGPEEYPTGGPNKEELELAEEIGYLLAKKNIAIITGGKGGVMTAVCQGAKKIENSLTIGVISGPRGTANQWTDIEVITGSKVAGWDEILIPLMSDAVIVIGGGAGTLQEISVCYRNRVPIIILNQSLGWSKKLIQEEFLDARETVKIISADSAKEAVSLAIKAVK